MKPVVFASPVVFAGPSLFGVDAAKLDGIELRPPAAKGDLLAAARAGASCIGLIDGTFEFGASVWHKEILFALQSGAAVYGAASLGALRAAECAEFGMVGVGRVYADYASGRRVSDADVAMVHAPAALGYKPLTEAQVDIEATLIRLMETGRIARDIALQLIGAAKTLHFKERSWTGILAHSRIPAPQSDELLSLLQAGRASVKTEDALALLDAVRAHAAKGSTARAPAFTFNHTLFFEELLNAGRTARP
jgi:hypothetical protein